MQENKINHSYFPQAQGMYNSVNEHDACGVGLVADINAIGKHEIVENGVEILERLMHRGAVGGDAQTGAGAGIMTQIPAEFFRREIPNLPEKGKYGVGMTFLPRDENVANACRVIVETDIIEEGLELLCWREVPVNMSAIGGMALESCPKIVQFFVKGAKDEDTSAFGAEAGIRAVAYI